MSKKQMLFNFPIKSDFSVENFVETAGNKQALIAINNLQNSGNVVVIYGGYGVGKTHLLTIWQNMLSAINFTEITEFNNQIKYIYAEDLEKLTPQQQEQLFHSFNHIKNVGGAMLVTSQIPPAQLNILPDLKSRLLLGENIEILPPNEQEMTILLAKWAWERQLTLPPEVINYILKKAERSPKTLEKCIVKLDKLSLEQKRKISIPLAKQALEEI